jgi:para-aminobenzoate synthetase component 1/para-aminobenzoate synthetase
VRRGIYSGALGYLDVRGSLDLSVVIRTLLVKQGWAYLHVGGGIVLDSVPVAEYRETLDKARALLAVLEGCSIDDAATDESTSTGARERAGAGLVR